MNDKDINKILIEWIRLAIGIPEFIIIAGNQRGKEPAGPFASIIATGSESVGLGESLRELDDGDATFTEQTSSIREVPVSLDFYRDGAHENARMVMHFPNTNTSKEFMYSQGFSLFVPTSYNNLDDLSEDGFIKRARMDLRLHCSGEYGETVNAIDEVPLTIESEQ